MTGIKSKISKRQGLGATLAARGVRAHKESKRIALVVTTDLTLKLVV